MHTALSSELASALVAERQSQAADALRARRLVKLRRWQRRAEQADRQVRLARLAVS